MKPVAALLGSLALFVPGAMLLASCSPRWRTPGSRNTGEIEKAFRTGAHHLSAKADGLQLLSRAECGLEQLDTALDRLALAAPQIKKSLIAACVQIGGADGGIQEREADLLRAIADTLDYPIPPFVETGVY